MTTERYALEHPGEWGESRLLARATFLEIILRHRPNVIQDLWTTVLPEFKRAVATRYCSQITEGLDLEEYQREKEAEFVENPQICGDYIVALLQHKLTLREAGGQESLRHEFFSFHKIDTANDVGCLSKKIQEWSTRWNLNAEWCLDHAVAVLRNWLTSDEIRWVCVFPLRLWSVQYEGWRAAVGELANEGTFSHVFIEIDMEADSDFPQPFRFSSQYDADWRIETSWNTAIETEAQFKKRLRINLKLAMIDIETQRLKTLKKEDESDDLSIREFEKRLASPNPVSRATVTKEFESELKEYLTTMRAWRENSKTKHYLTEAASGFQQHHLRWLMLYQIPDERGCCLSHAGIVEAASKLTLLNVPFPRLYNQVLGRYVYGALDYLFPELDSLSTESVGKTINKTAKLINLQLRNPRKHAGRPRGSRKEIPHRVIRS